MSRVIVRNLPDQITKEKLQKIFGEKGEVTDIQLKYTKDGKFRKFGFIGFKKPEQASAVIDSLNKTFINASQIQVELCSALSDPNKPRAWSKHAPDSTAFKKSHEKTIKENGVDDEPEKKKKKKKDKKIKDPEVEKLLKEHKDDPQFKEFLKNHLPGDDVLSELSGDEEDDDEEEKKESENKVANEEVSDLEYLRLKTGKKIKLKAESGANADVKNKLKLFTVKIKGIPPRATKSQIKDFLKPAKPFHIRRAIKPKSIAYCTFKTEPEMKKALIKHRSFMEGKRIFVTRSQSKEDSVTTKENKWKDQEERLKNEETVAESGRIFLRNLPYNVKEEEITELFEKYGTISEVILPVDSLTRLTKGYGIVTFLFPEHAVKAFNELDGTIFQGRMLHLLPGIASKTKDEDEEVEDGDYKKKKLLKQKSKAGSSTNWNTFFIGENTLAEAMAAQYKTTKDKVLDDTRQGAAVRLALGETQIINQIKEFLEENEVSLESFNNLTKCPRSKNVILVKNLPFGTKIEEIREKFSGYGELKRIILPPNGIAAIVEFIEASEAKKAFRNVAYSKFKHVPMYLEWAPEAIFSKKEPEDEKEKVKEKDEKKEVPAAPAMHESVEGAIIFVKNLNFSTDAEKLREHFTKCGNIVSATVAEKKDPKNPNSKLSMGYGFVEFSSKESADVALRDLQFSKLDNHTLELKRSNRTTKTEEESVRKSTKNSGKPSTKILVRNIPFQAKQKEVAQLFNVFGELKSVRLPKKMVGSGTHRGFCFVEFHSIHDAKKAFKALSQSTHLFGRRLVLEWAETVDDVETLREKTAEQYAPKAEKSKKGKATIAYEDVAAKKDENGSESESE